MSTTNTEGDVERATFYTTAGEPVLVSRRVTEPGRMATYAAVCGERTTERQRTFDDALAAVGLQVRRFRKRGKPASEISPAASAEEMAR